MRSDKTASWLIAVAILSLPELLSCAEKHTVLAVGGDVPKPQIYTWEELQKIPLTRATAREQDGAQAEYEGVSVEELLRRSGVPLGEHLRGPALAKAVVVHSKDGYEAVFSLAELDPGMTDRLSLLAWSRNHEPLPAAQGPLRLIVPGEKRPARWVRQVTALEVVSLSRPAITNASQYLPGPAKPSVDKK